MRSLGTSGASCAEPSGARLLVAICLMIAVTVNQDSNGTVNYGALLRFQKCQAMLRMSSLDAPPIIALTGFCFLCKA